MRTYVRTQAAAPSLGLTKVKASSPRFLPCYGSGSVSYRILHLCLLYYMTCSNAFCFQAHPLRAPSVYVVCAEAAAAMCISSPISTECRSAHSSSRCSSPLPLLTERGTRESKCKILRMERGNSTELGGKRENACGGGARIYFLQPGDPAYICHPSQRQKHR